MWTAADSGDFTQDDDSGNTGVNVFVGDGEFFPSKSVFGRYFAKYTKMGNDDEDNSVSADTSGDSGSPATGDYTSRGSSGSLFNNWNWF
jgi:uncharacterized NAD(P)/FAD-binding protein YdhS